MKKMQTNKTGQDSHHLCLIKNYKLINLRRNEAAMSLEESSFRYWAATSFLGMDQGSKIPKLPHCASKLCLGKLLFQDHVGHVAPTHCCRGASFLLSPTLGLWPPAWQEPRLGLGQYHVVGMTAPYQQETDSLGYCWSQAQLSLRLESPKATG